MGHWARMSKIDATACYPTCLLRVSNTLATQDRSSFRLQINDSIVPNSSTTMAAQSSLPHRGTGMSDDAVPDTDPSDVRLPLCGFRFILNAVWLCLLNEFQTSKILLERLQAYKHAVGYLEDYISTTEKMQKTHAKEYEKILKVGSCRVYRSYLSSKPVC